jgi:hypothetical protein
MRPRIESLSLFHYHYIRQERRRLDELVNCFEQRRLGKRLIRDDLMPFKTSNTIFILAGGKSINEITDAQWDEIAEHDTIGLNRWPIHEFVPTYYVFELPGSELGQMRQTFLNLLEYRKESYATTPTIIKDIDRTGEFIKSSGVESCVIGDLLFSRDTNFPMVSPQLDSQRSLLQSLHSRGYFRPGRPLDILYRERASISYLLHLSVLLGYQKIVLCGVDMVNSAYFFDDKRYRNNPVPIPEARSRKTDETHPTNDPDKGYITLESLIYLMNDIALKLNSVDLRVENTVSALHPRIPAYSYN